MTRRLLVLGCSSTKRELPAGEVLPLLELYDGPTWRVVRAFDRRSPASLDELGVDVYALSAEHGLVPASLESATYDRRMTRLRADALARESHGRLRVVAGAPGGAVGPELVAEVFVVAGAVYLPTIAGALAELEQLGVDVTIAAGGIGYKLGALRVWLEQLESPAGPVEPAQLQADDDRAALEAELEPVDVELSPAVVGLLGDAGRELGMCANHRCRRFEYLVAVEGDVELAVCDECSQRLVHESGLTWKDAAAAGYRRDTTERGNRA